MYTNYKIHMANQPDPSKRDTSEEEDSTYVKPDYDDETGAEADASVTQDESIQANVSEPGYQSHGFSSSVSDNEESDLDESTQKLQDFEDGVERAGNEPTHEAEEQDDYRSDDELDN